MAGPSWGKNGIPSRPHLSQRSMGTNSGLSRREGRMPRRGLNEKGTCVTQAMYSRAPPSCHFKEPKGLQDPNAKLLPGALALYCSTTSPSLETDFETLEVERCDQTSHNAGTPGLSGLASTITHTASLA